MGENLQPGTITTLGALRPGDVGEFAYGCGRFIVVESGRVVCRIQYEYDQNPHPRIPEISVRYLGQGRVEPARIVMEGKGDRIAELEEQVRTLREALNMYRSAFGQALEAHGIPLGPQQRLADEISEAALAATAPKEKP